MTDDRLAAVETGGERHAIVGLSNIAWPTLAALLVLTLGIVSFTISPPVIMAPWDVFILLDGGWRIINGQVPHSDFYTPIGPLVYWLSGLGIYAAGTSLKGISVGILLFFAVVMPWAMLVLFRKLPAPLAFLSTLFILLLILAVRPLGYSPSITTYAMIYNRYGWVLISILIVQLFLHDQSAKSNRATFDAISAGLLLGLLFLCKISFFVMGGATVVLASLGRQDLRRGLWMTVASFLVFCLVTSAVSGLDPMAYLRDLSAAGKSQSVSLRFLWLKQSLKANILPALLLVGCWLALIVVRYRRGEIPFGPAVQCSIIFWGLVASAMILTVGNATEGSNVPLLPIAVIILLVQAQRSSPSTFTPFSKSRMASVSSVAAFGTILLLIANVTGRDALSVINAYVTGPMRGEAEFADTFEATRLSNFTIPRNSNWATAYSRAGDVPAQINEGLGLLRQHITPDSHLLVLALTDPFSFALNLEPSKGAPLWWDLGISFSRSVYPKPDVVFANANFAIYPVNFSRGGCCEETVAVLLEIYGDYLKSHFMTVGKSQHWVLMQRRD
ncbi:hypothetical protein M2281_003867 [Mesorhizobium soli]|uniref:hypothetical protein n=1 Tax=Pseudaminobacter soli (ex Li et al. 2025) TaxID=1295366 RepID=UPI0024745854|nr:hypothetical protein [Mesorhizobium soli]MDH6233256.1 hypothetical protein [Mesorhizobium soli]